MKKLGYVALLCVALLFVMQANAQYLSFDKIEYDYGILPTNTIDTRALFSCTNRGTEDIVITKVVPSSKSVTCELTRDTLRQGIRSSLNVTFNSAGYSSIFTEYIDVFTTDKMLGKITLKLTGTVKDIDSTIIQMYPSTFDLVRMDRLRISYGTINYPETVTDTIVVYNPQDTAISLIFPNVPNYLTVQMFPEVIQPNSTALMVVSFNSELRKEWGTIYDRLYLGFQGKKVNYKMKLSISGTITEDFSNLTKEQLKNAPKIKFDTDVFNFDTVKRGEQVACKFHFINKGKSTLEIRKIKTTCGCTAGSMEKMSYAKGEDGYVNVTLNTTNKHGHVRQAVIIISNDPENSETRVFIEGNVKDNTD
ncbi:MAG: DUF1573 domain-containing protein [Bacteroidales bacterium]|nr:DUF1573 domain-containing protein [Bacteroidales bacterium]